ncbi:hypothetical protein [Streptomyces sp. Ag109_G2-15]|uniref:hypothetical protein n=1 Tax=Streptomyces sp. Ag109_G2-15 TaxID=1938850 RepID=UPI000BD338CD|nr:hypothetical protein [Streptomyces sp. Ag109_G2-15]SOD85880.1 hypothetical protein SAMN06272765_3316 [Streptomyces sp. Ag109_G2-15]
MADKGEDPQAVAAAAEASASALAASGIVPIAAVGAAMAQLRVEGETLTTFKNRVDDLLTRLEESKAAPHRISDGALPTGRLGNFGEANALHNAYSSVHSRLEHLSRMLALQIEGLMVTVDASKSNYHDLDDGVRARLHRIRVEADKLAVDGARPGAEGHANSGVGGPSRGRHGSKSDSQAGDL